MKLGACHKNKIVLEEILQGLRVAQAAVTERWHISSSYAKILGEKLFHTWEIPRSGSKAEDGEKREKERGKVGDNNGQATHGPKQSNLVWHSSG